MEMSSSVYTIFLCVGIFNICIAIYALYYYTSKTPESHGYIPTKQSEDI